MLPASSKPANSPRRKPNPGRRDLLELLLGYTAILLVLWTPPPFQRPLYWLAAAVLLVVSLRSRANRDTLGLTTKHLASASRILLPVTLLAGTAVALALHYKTLHIPPTPRAFLNRYWGYAIWSFAQQFLLQDFFLLRLRRIFPARNALSIILAASLFAFAHVPSPILTPFTLIWGLAACAWFLRFPNLFPLALAHAILGITVSCTIPNHITHNMRAGLGYLTYHQHPTAPRPQTNP